MSVTMVSPIGRVFAGMVFPDDAPITSPQEYIKPVHMFGIPAQLREHAHTFLDGEAADGQWWTVGEFRYAGEDYLTAYARRVIRDGRVQTDYGIETDD